MKRLIKWFFGLFKKKEKQEETVYIPLLHVEKPRKKVSQKILNQSARKAKIKRKRRIRNKIAKKSRKINREKQ